MNLQFVAILLALMVSFFLGEKWGQTHSTEFLNFATIERRQKEIFCELAIRNGLLKTCDPYIPRLQEGL